MRKFKILVLLSSGTTSYYETFHLDKVEDFHSNSSGYYFFKMEDGLVRYFPIEKTIIFEV
jgi:hypothetical protein